MSTALAIHVQAATSFALLGLIWVVQLVQYPGFRQVPIEAFPTYHAHHCRRIAWVVGPLMLAELAAAIVLMVRPGPLPPDLQRMILGCVLLVWFSTATLQVPLHRRLALAATRADMDRLVATNWLRTGAWSAKAMLVLVAELTR